MYQQVRTCECHIHVAAGEKKCGRLMHVPAGENMWTSYACTNWLEHVDVLYNKDGEKNPNSLSFVALWCV